MKKVILQSSCKRLFVVLAFLFIALGVRAVEPAYYPGDVAVINAMIDNNGLNWPKAPTDGSSVPAAWAYSITLGGCKWSPVVTNKRLEELYIYENITGAIDLSRLGGLKNLVYTSYQPASLNVSGCTGLITLECYGGLTSLNVTGCSNLTTLSCGNNKLTSLDLSGCSKLQSLNCRSNLLTSLDVSACVNLVELDCSINQLTSLNISRLANLEVIVCTEMPLASLNISDCSKLRELNCSENEITSMNLSRLNNLKKLNCESSKLTSLDLSGLSSLEILACSYNKLTSLDASGASSLTIITCDYNELTSLNVAGLSNLETLTCDGNKLTSLNLSGLTNLARLSCYQNQLTTLDASLQHNLKHLMCRDNKLTSLTVSLLSEFNQLDCSYNNLTWLDMRGSSGYPLIANHQTTSLTMTWNSETLKYEAAIALNDPYLNLFRGGITYANGKLIADDNSNRSTPFYVQTGFPGNILEGNISLTYDPPYFIPVTDITAVPTAATAGTPLTLTATVVPSDATNKTITWSIASAGTTGATINGNTLNATAAGTVAVTATIANGTSATTNFTKNFNITVTSTAASIYNTGDIAVINAMIDNNRLGWTKAPVNGSSIPADWYNILWSSDATNKRIRYMVLANMNLTGAFNIQGLSNLEEVHCYDNQLTSINASGLSNLKALYCSGNKLTSINVSGLTKLDSLHCFDNQLTSLNLSGLTNLKGLYCLSNKLTTLDASGLTNLKDLRCSGNKLTALNLQGLSSLSLFAGGNQTQSLALTSSGTQYEAAIALNSPTGLASGITYSNGKLISNSNTIPSTPFTVATGLTGKSLSGTLSLTYSGSSTAEYNTGDIAVINAIIDNNGLGWTKAPVNGSAVPADWTEVIWSGVATNKRIVGLELEENNLTGTLNVKGLSMLEWLWCYGNRLTALEVAGLNNLRILACYTNEISSLNLSGLAKLEVLSCFENQLTTLNTSGLSNLKELSIGTNKLATLNVSGLTKLERLDCYENQLTSLNVSELTNLKWLNCFKNQFTSLNVSGLSNLTYLNCVINRITSLNVAGLTKLEHLRCSENHLTQLNLTGLPPSLDLNAGVQTSTLTLALNPTTQKYEATIPLNSPTGLASGITYSNGKLISNSNTIASTPFTVATGLTGKSLFGTLSLTYGTSSSIYNSGDIAVINAIIDNNGLGWTKAPVNGSAVPADWTKVEWSSGATNKRVIKLDISSKNLTGTLNVSGLADLRQIYCFFNQLTAINVSGLTKLEYLYCFDNPLTALDLSTLTGLTALSCGKNNLTALDLSGQANLQGLYCTDNKLTSINLAGKTKLENIYCSGNQLTALNVAGLSNLDVLSCENNKLTSLNLSGLTGLNELYCSNNHLTALNLTGIPESVDYEGKDQTSTLTLALNPTTQKYEATIPLNSPTGLAPGITYSAGKLTASGNTVSSTSFIVQTGLAGKELSGTIGLTYTSSSFIPVTSISGAPTATTAGTPLTLAATIAPSNATNKTIVWSVKSQGTTGASINGNTLNTTSAGTAIITATVLNGASPTTNFSADFTVAITAATGAESPAPFALKAVAYNGYLSVSGLNAGDFLYIYNMSGVLVFKAKAASVEMTVDLAPGLYIIESGRRTVKAAVK